VGFDPDPALLAEVVQEEAVSSHPLDVYLVRVEDEHASLYHSLSGIDCKITVHHPSPIVVLLPLREL
jgi:hypothetical protein